MFDLGYMGAFVMQVGEDTPPIPANAMLTEPGVEMLTEPGVEMITE